MEEVEQPGPQPKDAWRTSGKSCWKKKTAYAVLAVFATAVLLVVASPRLAGKIAGKLPDSLFANMDVSAMEIHREDRDRINPFAEPDTKLVDASQLEAATASERSAEE
jgi:hypothetical protein